MDKERFKAEIEEEIKQSRFGMLPDIPGLETYGDVRLNSDRLKLYKSVLDLILGNLESLSNDDEIDALYDKFDRARFANNAGKIELIKPIQNEIYDERKEKISKEQQKFKRSLGATTAPIFEVENKINTLESLFKEKRKVFDRLQSEIFERKQKADGPHLTEEIGKIRQEILALKEEELEDVHLGAVAFELDDIASQLADAYIEYNKKMIQYIESLSDKELKIRGLLSRWDEKIENAKEVGFLSRCTERVSNFLTNAFSAIQKFISDCKCRISSEPTHDESVERSTELLKDFVDTGKKELDDANSRQSEFKRK